MTSIDEVPESFAREVTASEVEWQRLMAVALAGWVWQADSHQAVIDLSPGRLRIDWQCLPPRQLALLRLPVLRVRFEFTDVTADARRAFMTHFDRYTHRGGG